MDRSRPFRGSSAISLRRLRHLDHGTAFDIAGTGKASAVSMIEVIKVAAEYAVRGVRLGDDAGAQDRQSQRHAHRLLEVHHLRRAAGKRVSSEVWFEEVRALLTDRPASWATLASKTPGKLHPLEVFRALKPHVAKYPDTVLICDGGEFAQWGQSVLPVVPRRKNVRNTDWTISSGSTRCFTSGDVLAAARSISRAA